MSKLNISLEDIEFAFQLSDYDLTAYLDTVTGKVVHVSSDDRREIGKILADVETLEDAIAAVQQRDDLEDWERQQYIDAVRVEYDFDDRYIEIPHQDSSEGYRDMEDFIGSVTDPHLRELLEVAIDGRGAFGRFKGVLSRHDDARDAWFQFSEKRQRERIEAWLRSRGITPEFT